MSKKQGVIASKKDEVGFLEKIIYFCLKRQLFKAFIILKIIDIYILIIILYIL